jgi:CxxC motif-containing protein (DUF1111 family)
MRAARAGLGLFVVSAVLVTAARAGESGRGGGGMSARDAALDRGLRLFVREWLPNDPRGRGGDGLGPVFNERSCVACHGLVRPGGAGSNATNVELLTAVAVGLAKGQSVDRSPLAALHEGLAQTGSIVLHRFGLSPVFPEWRKRVMKFNDEPPAPIDDGEEPAETPTKFRLRLSRRNSPALFGGGRIDTIPDRVLESEERRQASGKTIHGRVSRLPSGRIGRFGWKGQMADLDTFVRTACASELGLEVPGHHQAGDPLGFASRSETGLDMSEDDCRDLVGYVRALPVPTERSPDPAAAAAGRQVFERFGCAGCHRPNLGAVDGLYSDLLLHDMGPDLSDEGRSYGSANDGSPSALASQEWRTPPLWALADTGPYLHDGRAQTVSAAIRAHGGEARDSAIAFSRLPARERSQLLTFLRSLKAPPGSPRKSTAATRAGAGGPADPTVPRGHRPV